MSPLTMFSATNGRLYFTILPLLLTLYNNVTYILDFCSGTNPPDHRVKYKYPIASGRLLARYDPTYYHYHSNTTG